MGLGTADSAILLRDCVLNSEHSLSQELRGPVLPIRFRFLTAEDGLVSTSRSPAGGLLQIGLTSCSDFGTRRSQIVKLSILCCARRGSTSETASASKADRFSEQQPRKSWSPSNDPWRHKSAAAKYPYIVILGVKRLRSQIPSYGNIV
jgi:hypothetical protein